uniref:Methionine--tRNA ligase n=1 Tax=Zeugodacus cucurbitae TaxID=28588 RepID=A0A0A1WEA5_ZEUCU
MKAFYILFGCFCLNWSIVVGQKGKKLGPPIDLDEITTTTTTTRTTTTVAPTETTTPLVAAATNNVTVNPTAFNNTSIYDQKHKILLVVLSDVNVRHVKDPTQASNLGQSSTNGNNPAKKSSNETFLIDATMLKEILKKLQPTNKCVTIAPHYVPPTFPWIIRKEPRKPITYIEPILCEDVENERVVLTGSLTWPENQKRQPNESVKTKSGYARTRSSKNNRKRQRSKSRTGAVKDSSHLPFSLSHLRNLDYEHEADFDKAWADFSSEEN